MISYFGYSKDIIPQVQDVFAEHGTLSKNIAAELSLKEGIPVTYKSGDQPNNALSLNVLQPGEVAATAGTSGVIYGVSDQLTYDPQSRVNSFAHVNHNDSETRVGVLLCINGTGILNRWMKNVTGNTVSYSEMNKQAASVPAGSEGVYVLPFGNGAERILNNRQIGAHIQNLDFNKHTTAHMYRAAQEGIAFAFRYGLDIMRSNGMKPNIIRAGKANMFLSPVFTEAFVNATGTPVEMNESDGSIGAAIGAGIGAGFFSNAEEAFEKRIVLNVVEPTQTALYNDLYEGWKSTLEMHLNMD